MIERHEQNLQIDTINISVFAISKGASCGSFKMQDLVPVWDKNFSCLIWLSDVSQLKPP